MIIYYRNQFIKNFLIFLGTIILGLILLFVGIKFMVDYYPDKVILAIIVALVIIFIGYFFFIWSHYYLAKAKGYNGWLVLLGFTNFGLLILFLLPDRRKVENNSNSTQIMNPTPTV